MNPKHKHFWCLFFLCSALSSAAQHASANWQQKIEYQIDVRLDDQANAAQGREKIRYINQSPDTLKRLYLHLYWNAAQPQSKLARVSETWQRELDDLKKNEQGKVDVFYVHQNGVAVSFQVKNTLLVVDLSRPLAPNDYDMLDIAWQAQIPKFTATAGRKSPGGLAYVFGHWYPKMCGYDADGWHLNPKPLLENEDRASYATYRVDITLPKKYMVAATGLLLNAASVGAGYQDSSTVMKPNYTNANTWKFVAEQVKDFAFVADADLSHEKTMQRQGLEIHHFYSKKKDAGGAFAWAERLKRLEADLGAYPYAQCSFFSAAGPAFEFPMLVFCPEKEPSANAFFWEQSSLWNTSVADASLRNALKSNAFLQQLRYVSGEKNYAQAWKQLRSAQGFNTLDPSIFSRTFEQASGIELDWFFAQWSQSNQLLNYAVESIKNDGDGSLITLKNAGSTQLPLEVLVVTKGDAVSLYYIPLENMLRHPKNLDLQRFTLQEAWPDGENLYRFHVPIPEKNIRSVTIDPDGKTKTTNEK